MPDQAEADSRSGQEIEVYAGFLEHTDHHVGGIDLLDDLSVLGRARLLHRRRRRASARHVNGEFNKTFLFNGATALQSAK